VSDPGVTFQGILAAPNVKLLQRYKIPFSHATLLPPFMINYLLLAVRAVSESPSNENFIYSDLL
jgi:hypothetical protein